MKRETVPAPEDETNTLPEHFAWSPANNLMKNSNALAGILILVMILATIVAGLAGDFTGNGLLWLGGVSGWLAAAILARNTPLVLRIQVGALLATGIGLISYATTQGAQIDWLKAVSTNTALLTMIASVGFLRLVALPETGEVRRLPTGARAYLQTLVGVGVFASVINVSAPILIADRIHRQRPLTRFTSQSITRIFCGMSNWSPFYGAMAAILTYVSDARLSWIIATCLPFSLLGALVVWLEAKWRYADQVENFVGYPMHLEALMVPALLMATVAAMSLLLTNVSILVVIALCAFAVTVGLLLFRNSPRLCIASMTGYVTTGLPGMVNELSLFLAAGVLSVGMSAMIDIGAVVSPFHEFNTTTAIQILGIMLLLSAAGIHPIIVVSSFTPMLLELDPNPTLLAIVYLMAWNLGTGSSYLSGTHLVFQGRYGIPSWKAAMWNWPYAIFMFALATIWLQLVAWVLQA